MAEAKAARRLGHPEALRSDIAVASGAHLSEPKVLARKPPSPTLPPLPPPLYGLRETQNQLPELAQVG